MAGNTVKVDLKVEDQSGTIKRRMDEARLLNKELERSKELAGGGRTRALAAQNIEYGRARGAMGGTGASARDFANEAQGLGGLVRLYATVAANTFAATAAFNALKEAADTTTLREGLNQLGAASGIALGSLAKSFVAATDGAVSFRDAAQAASKATSAGLTSRQFLEIGEYAKKASQALGVDMNDAVSRLTRGIVKLEPELLDELGLFTKIGPAVEEYARKLGKTESSLTDFERRQAFAVAVLEEARKKYKEIEIPTNPYQQLLATLKDVTQAGLELLNKFLLPVVSVFANNSALVVAAIAAVGAKLIGMAIPALSGWSKGLKDSADEAKKYATAVNVAFGESAFEKIKRSFNVPDITKNLASAEQAFKQSQDALTKIQQEASIKRRSMAYKEQDLQALKEDPAAAKKLLRSISTEIKAQEASMVGAGTIDTNAAKQRIELLEARKRAVQDITKYTKELTTATNAATDAAIKQGTTFGETIRSRISRQAAARAERLDILSNIGATVDSAGFKAAIDEINKKLSDSKTMGAFDKFRTKITGTFLAATASVGNFLSAFGPWGAVIGAGVAVLGILDGWLSTNSRQLAEFTSQVEKNNDTVDNATRVLAKYKGILTSTESITATATSLGELTDSVDQLRIKFEAVTKAQGWWDRFKDSITPERFSTAGELAKSVAQNWAKEIEQLPESELKSATILKLKNIFSIKDVGVESLRKAILQSGDYTQAIKEGQSALQPAVAQTRQLGLNAQATKDSLDKLNKSSQDLQNSFLDQSPLAKFAQDLIRAALDVQKSFADMGTAIAAFKEILSKPGAFALIDREQLTRFQDALKVQDEIVSKQAGVREEQARIEQLKADLGNKLRESGGRFINPLLSPQERIREEQQLPTLSRNAARQAGIIYGDIINRQRLNDERQKQIDEANARGVKDLFAAVLERFKEVWKQGFDLLAKSAKIAEQQSNLQIQRSIVSGVTGPGIAQTAFELNRQDIQLQREQLEVTGKLIEQLSLNTLAQQEATYLREREPLVLKREGIGLSLAEQERLSNIEKGQRELEQLRTSVQRGTTISAEQAQSFQPEIGALAFEKILRAQGYEIKRRELATKDITNELDRQINVLKEEALIQSDGANATLKQLQYRQQLVGLSLVNIDYLNQEQLIKVQALETEKLQQEQLIQNSNLRTQIAELQLKLNQEYSRTDYMENSVTEGLRTRLEYARKILGVTEQQQQQDLAILKIQQQQQMVAVQFIKITEQRKFDLLIQEKAAAVQEAELQLNQQILEVVNSRGTLSEDEYKRLKKIYDLKSLDLELTNSLRSIEARRADELQRVEEARAKAVATSMVTEVPNPVDAANFARLTEAEKDINRRADVEVEALRRVQAIRKQGIELQTLETDRQKSYADIFKRSFDSLADAIVNWAQTGKFASKDLFASLTADLLRYELKLQTTQLYGLARPGIIEGVAAIFGGPAVRATPFGGSVQGGEFGGAAKGAYFDGNISKFASGGMFTNSIVNKPTLFKFARGTGLMGEAGPEAIMPLKRDSQGNLGVSGNGGANVEVIVNNNTGQPATTRESTDSRGNRRVEVIVGDMVAGELARTGSGPQTTMRNMFNVQPRLTRR